MDNSIVEFEKKKAEMLNYAKAINKTLILSVECSSDEGDKVSFAEEGRAVLKNELIIDAIKKQIILDLSVDEEICTMYDYFDIFLERMLLSRAAAEKMLRVKFKLRVNGNKVL